MRVARLGLDIGSTTIKAIVEGERVHLRHRGDLRRGVREALGRLGPLLDGAEVRSVVTGSGAAWLAEAWGAPRIHEVVAVAEAARGRHPEARAIVELGGQDAKLVLLDGDRASHEMNDRCAAGTGVTIDRCLLRLGIDADRAAALELDGARLHPLSSKCGVFCETDLVNLARAGVPLADLVASLADAIVLQNLAVLARGRAILPRVLLLGGPHAFFPALARAWRRRMSERWGREAGEDVLVPEGAMFFAVEGALRLAGEGGATLPVAELLARLDGVPPASTVALDAPLRGEAREAAAIEMADEERGRLGELLGEGVAVGIDVGSTRSKLVAIDGRGRVVARLERPSGKPIEDALALLGDLRLPEGVQPRAVGVTGYGAALVAPALGARAVAVETVAHARAARAWFPDAEVVCDVGGQDVKILSLDAHGGLRDFRLSAQCTAGIGQALEATAREVGVAVEDYAARAGAARRAPRFGQTCVVFLDSDRVTFQQQGFTGDEILAGMARALPRLVWEQILDGEPLARWGRIFVLQGGAQRNAAVVEAEVDHLRAAVPGAVVHVHPWAVEAGAIGAALCAVDEARAGRGEAAWILPSGVRVTVENQPSLRCPMCRNACPRARVTVERSDGGRETRWCGAGCSVGEEGDADGLERLRRRRRELPNLLDEEVRLLFSRSGVVRVLRPATARRRIGIPRTLPMYRAAPLFRGYLEALGVSPRDVVFSPVTSEDLWREGAGHGATDACFPVKVSLAHVHHLLHRVHDGGGRLDAIFAPRFTHAQSPVRHLDCASCPVVTGAPTLIRAAFGGAGGELERRGVLLLDPTVTMIDVAMVRAQLFGAFGGLLEVDRATSDRAVAAGFAAMQHYDRRLQAAARRVLDGLEADPRRGAVLVLGRPYHADPGLNHRLGEELQALGYPVLTARSLPRDRAFLERLLAEDLASGRIGDPWDVRDLIPDSANSGANERTWAARVAARHGRIAVVDVSSFKCTQDAPAFGPELELLSASGTPHCLLADLDETRPVASLRLRLRTLAAAMRQRGLDPWSA